MLEKAIVWFTEKGKQSIGSITCEKRLKKCENYEKSTVFFMIYTLLHYVYENLYTNAGLFLIKANHL